MHIMKMVFWTLSPQFHQALPPGSWFCSVECGRLSYVIKVLVTRRAQKVPDTLVDTITNLYVKWVVVHGKHASEEDKSLLAEAADIFHAEFGFAAHWRYKEGDCMHSTFVLHMVEWALWVVTWQCETMMKDQSSIGYTDAMKPPCKFRFHSEDCPHSYKPSCGSDGPVFVIVIENNKVIYKHNNLSDPYL
ncbi:hypothetical protein Hanom_Chr13g01222301 [Helianthus anomalus]